ncbi:hypothetical protein [Saccharothrix violaceirubra]|uniref:Uncharacterized protein n=1 Tax=Saccharothrix violaceirubra TaxID=413306 RepID=A0A7W7T1B9_9PSEU|nr:hypothetical protein [Saccharothrix violaceirubra]MBB4964750.1 hypothetical protein [Saccharothrix violaceirubra]
MTDRAACRSRLAHSSAGASPCAARPVHPTAADPAPPDPGGGRSSR